MVKGLLALDGVRTDSPLGRKIVNGESPVLSVVKQLVPTVKHVVQGSDHQVTVGLSLFPQKFLCPVMKGHQRVCHIPFRTPVLDFLRLESGNDALVLNEVQVSDHVDEPGGILLLAYLQRGLELVVHMAPTEAMCQIGMFLD